MKTRRHWMMWMLPVLLAAMPTTVHAQAPLATDFSYQGQLKVAGAPLDGTADFEFALWDDPEAGSQVGDTVAVSDVDIADGLFTVALDFGVEVFNGDARWLEIAVRSPAGGGGFTALVPRQPLTGIPYALQTRGMYCDAGGQVGIGTALPETRMHVDGGCDVGLAGGGFLVIGPTAGLNLGMDTNEIMARNNSGASTLYLNNDGGNVAIAKNAPGALGIGTENPTAPLTVVRPIGGSVVARFLDQEAATSALDIRATSLRGEIQCTSLDEPADLALNPDGGNVGIGTSTPEAKLDVDANALVGMQIGSAGHGAMIEYQRNDGDYRFYTGIPNVTNSTWEIQNVDHNPLLAVRWFGDVGIGTSDPSHRLTIVSPDNDTLRLIGPGVWGTQARVNFQDGDLVYIDNPSDGYLTAQAYANITLDAPSVDVTGMLSKAGGSFKIDHPLDPEHKYLYHSFVESPDMMNVYNGNILTDADGFAVVTLPDWFETLNRDFRYQLTVIGQFAQAIVAEEIRDNAFVIQTDRPGVKVSWQVTGIRQDAWAEANRIPVEVDKPADEWGHYLHPEAFGIETEQGRGRDAKSSATSDSKAYDQ